MPPLNAAAKKLVFGRSGNRCSIPNCNISLVTSDGYLLGDIAHIVSLHRGGPRHDATIPAVELEGPDNLIVLCPNHHKLIDSQPELYTADWLRNARKQHEAMIAAQVVPVSKTTTLQHVESLTFTHALEVWRDNTSNSDEEFWQRLFREHPHLIAQAVPNHVIQLDQKCYLGGKGINNSGGNVVDFLYVVHSTSNLVVVEIKTPTTKLLGPSYRANAHSISEELTGAMVQALNYRDQATKNYHHLSAESEHEFTAFNPLCLVIAGNVSGECADRGKKRSLDLFRSASQMMILGYDELFAKVQNLVDILG